jgi:hypothetical protein
MGAVEGGSPRRLSMEVRRDWMGGKELFEEILPKDEVLNACAKEGSDCGG